MKHVIGMPGIRWWTARVPPTPGGHYMVRLSSVTTQGCYGVAFNDGDPHRGGTSALSTDGGAAYTPEPARDLKFFRPVSATALRLVVTDTNDHDHSRVLELEAYAN